MRGARFPFLVLLAVLGAQLTAGCLRDAPGAGTPSPPFEPDPLRSLDEALVNDHDHSDPDAHPLVEWNVRHVFESYLPMSGAPASAPSEFTIHGSHAFVATFSPAAGFTILDLEDPARPVHVGRYDAGTPYTNDVEVSDDGRWAFVPTQPWTVGLEGLADGLPVAGDYGVHVVDLADLSQPRLATAFVSEDAGGYHRLDVERIGGALFVFGTACTLRRIDILRFEEAPVPRVTQVGAYTAPDAESVPPPHTDCGPTSRGIHDVSVTMDPVDGFPLLAVAHWAAGAYFADVSDPTNPRHLGHWDGFVDVIPGNVHNVEVAAVEGRRLAFAVPEYPAGHERQGILWIIDLSDFSRPALLGTWSLPGTHPIEGGTYVFSTDRVEVRNGTAFLAHFHAGVIVLDVSTLANATSPPMVGFILPPAADPVVEYNGIKTNPIVYDAIPRGNHLYFTDLNGKFHVAELDPALVKAGGF